VTGGRGQRKGNRDELKRQIDRGEACDYMTGIGKKRELRSQWQRVCKLILAKEDVLTVSRALELALFMDAKLDVSKVKISRIS
jgi:hypothetical protein